MTWNFAYSPYIWPSVFAVLLLLALSAYSWGRRSIPGALPFTIGSLLAALWAFGSVMEVATADVTTKIFWVKFQAIWQLPATTAITCFILEYTWPGRWLTRRNLALLSIAPLLVFVLILTNDLHHLAWRGFTFDGSIIPLISRGSWVFIAYSYALGFFEFTVFVWLFFRSPQHRWPVVVILTGVIVGRLIYVLDVAHIIKSGLHLELLNLPIVFLGFAIALFGFRIFDPIPMAHRLAIEQLYTGLVVLDPQGRVASLNPSAERILGAPASRAKGQLMSHLLPAYQDGKLAVPDGTETEFTLGAGQGGRSYTLEVSPLKDWRGLEVGRLLMLRDVTEQKQAHAQIVNQQRTLATLKERERMARELHDSLGQVFAFVNAQGQTVRRLLARNDISKADEYVARLVKVAQEADVDIRESILGLRVTLSEQGLFPALKQYLERYEKNYGIHADLEVPETFADGSFEPLVEVQLLRILQEAMTNVRKHANASSVRIIFTFENGWGRVTVQDDGQGFDLKEREDRSSEHVGLRVMRERAEEVGGSLAIQSKPGEGTQIVITVPLRQGVPSVEKTI